MKSARGIYYNLKESEYYFKYNNFTFYFSSNLYLEKFKKRIKEFIVYESTKLESLYGYKIDCDYLLYLKLYKTIEKRGYYVLYHEKELPKDPIFKLELRG